MGVLAPHPIHHVLVHPGQGQDRVGEGEFLVLAQTGLDPGVDPLQHPVEPRIMVAGEDIQALDHTEGVERGPGRLGAHIGHAEDLPAFELFLKISNDI